MPDTSVDDTLPDFIVGHVFQEPLIAISVRACDVVTKLLLMLLNQPEVGRFATANTSTAVGAAFVQAIQSTVTFANALELREGEDSLRLGVVRKYLTHLDAPPVRMCVAYDAMEQIPIHAKNLDSPAPPDPTLLDHRHVSHATPFPSA